MEVFLHILTNNILSISILVLLGFILSKKFNLDIYTLAKLNFYIFVPVFVFVNLYTTDIPADMIKVVLFALGILMVNYIIGNIIARIRKYDIAMTNAFKNSIMFYNSGNIGVPVIMLVFSSPPFVADGGTPYLGMALTVQIIIMVIQNISSNTLGFINAGRVNTQWKDSFKRILRMPTIYVMPCAFILKMVPYDLALSPVWPALNHIRNGLIPVALLTLGVQLSKTRFRFGNMDVYLSVFTRLVGGPLLAFVLINLMQFQGVFAQTLLISSSVPTAVNTALIAVECDNQSDFSSQAVMVSTLLSAATLTLIIYTARVLFPIV